MSNDIIVIADTQVKAGSDLSHLEALSVYIWQHKPKHIVHIGDHWDFESLSYYASPLEKEGKRLIDDIRSGKDALKLIMQFVDERVAKAKGKTKYNPHMHFCEGNHEQRLKRFIDSNPQLLGLIDLKGIVEKEGWKFHDFLKPVEIDDVVFRHYLVNPQSGKAVGGSIENKLNKTPYSFVHGHQQQFQMARRQNALGKPHFGVCAGSFYMEDEGYRGYENTEIRGFVHLKNFTNRYGYSDYDVEFVSLERLLEDY